MKVTVLKPGLVLAALLAVLPSLLAAQQPAPPKVVAAPAKHPVANKIPLKDQVDLNNASKAALKKLPGITDVFADKIIAGRPYLTKTRLVTKGVLTNDLFQQIRDHVYVGAIKAAGK